MRLRIKDIVQIIEEIAPPHYAASWDNSGLQIGALDDPVRSILISLDITHGVIKEAIDKKVNLIITHHPLFFHPIKEIRTDSGYGSLLQRLLKADIAVYTAHTNLDLAQDGVNDLLGKTLGLQEWRPIHELPSSEGIGWGLIGEFENARTFSLFAAELKKALGIKWARMIGKPAKKVKQVACCSGSGSSLFPDVVRHKPDLFITGDIKYHEAINFEMEGIPVLDIGHFASEHLFRKSLAATLRQTFMSKKKSIPVFTSRSEKDPFRII